MSSSQVGMDTLGPEAGPLHTHSTVALTGCARW